MKCFYHSADLDGHCSGAIVKYAHPRCDMWPVDYGHEDKFPWDKIRPDEVIYMVDFSLQPFELMVKLQRLCPNLIWIDHHESAIEAHKDWNKTSPSYLSIQGERRVGVGACAIVWEFLFPNLPLPLSVKLLAEYDVWNMSDPRTLPFQYGMRLKNTDPSNSEAMGLWELLLFQGFPSLIYDIIGNGYTCLDYQKQLNARLCKEAFEVEFEGMKCLAINGRGNSKVFDSIWNPDKYDAMILFFVRANRRWVVNLYTTHDHIDLSKIARARGGGGHAQAAGFVCDELPF